MSGRRRIARDVVMWGFAGIVTSVLDILTKRRLGMTIRFPWPRDVSSGAMRTTGNRPIVPGATGQALSAGETRES
jgi:hypothetical protein